MKINFDSIKNDSSDPFEPTFTSLFTVPSKNPQKTSNSFGLTRNLAHSYVIDSKFQEEKSQKIPRKFTNIKTIQEMQSFIHQMNKEDSTKNLHKNSKLRRNTALDLANQNLEKTKLSAQESQRQEKIQAVTTRLYQTFKDNREITNFCKKKSCKLMISTFQKHFNEDLQNFTGQPNKDRNQSFKDSFSKFYHSLDTSIDNHTCEDSKQEILMGLPSRVHQRLFKDASTRRQLKEKEQKRFFDSCIQLSRSLQTGKRASISSSKSPSKSKGFYERLDELTARHKNRPKICQLVYSQNAYFLNKNGYRRHKKLEQQKPIHQLQKLVFEKAQLLSKNLTKCTKAKCHQSEVNLKSLKAIQIQQKPYISDKTQQIMEETQRKLMKRIKGLFFDKKTKNVKVNSAKIYTLSEREFAILFELISNVEKKSIKSLNEKKLEIMIEKFYKNLGFSQKQELRRLYMTSQTETKEKKFQNEKDEKKSSQKLKEADKNVTDCSSFDTEFDYCAKLAMYI